jgi:hypothetical protein
MVVVLMAGASSWSSWRRLGFHHRHDDDGPTAKMVALNIRSNEFKFRRVSFPPPKKNSHNNPSSCFTVAMTI